MAESAERDVDGEIRGRLGKGAIKLVSSTEVVVCFPLAPWGGSEGLHMRGGKVAHHILSAWPRRGKGADSENDGISRDHVALPY
jgi:hypothetical protein